MNTIREHLKNGNFLRFYVLTGTEEYLCRTYRGRLEKAMLPEDDTMNRMVFEGNKTDPMQVLDAALMLPFFAERRLIILVDTGWLKSSCPLADHLDEIPETTYFIFLEKETDKRNKLYKYIEANGHIAVFEPLREQDAVSFTAALLKRNGLAITEQNARLLIEQAGNDMNAISNETDKLAAYCAGRDEVTRDDILSLTSAMTQGHMFKMVDAIVMKNRKQAFALYKDLLADQTPPMVILYNLTNSFYQFSLILRLLRKGLSAFDIGQQLKMNSYAVTKYIRFGRNANLADITDAVALGNELDAKVKSGNITDRMAVEVFLAKQCGA